MLARRIERDPAQDHQLVARLVERPRQDLGRILGVPGGHLPPRLHHARGRVAQPVALRLLADKPQQRRHRLLGRQTSEFNDLSPVACALLPRFLWQDVSLHAMFYKLAFVKASLLILLATNVTAQTPESELVAKYGETQRPRIVRGIAQVRQFWRESDGDAKQQADFIRANFAGDRATLDALFARMELT